MLYLGNGAAARRCNGLETGLWSFLKHGTCVPALSLLLCLLTTPSVAQSADCFTLLREARHCTDDGYRYDFWFRNDSPYVAHAVSVLGPGQPTADLRRLSVPLPSGDSTLQPILVAVTGDTAYCFDLVVRRLHADVATSLNCCYLTLCVEPPPRPRARVIDPAPAACPGELLQLDATPSRPPSADFRWRADGPTAAILSGATTARPIVEGGGAYTLTVTDPVTGCQDSTRVDVRIPAPVRPVDDSIAVTGQGPVLVDILTNDGAPPGTLPVLTTQPEVGTATITADGRLRYEPPPCFNGTVELVYSLAEGACPDPMATATVTLTGFGYELYNVITPDGDGRNETFHFDLLDYCPGEYPNNRIEIFNRWGDIVYRAAPYRNEWAGTNQRGGPLPEATYYYILRLDLGQGLVLRGEVTVLR